MPPFVVFALPRSRTAWLARFLTYRAWECAHDEIRHCRSLEDVKAWLNQPCVGSVETAAAPFWRLLPALRPDARVVVVRRPVGEVVDSLMRLRLGCFEPASLTAAIRRLDRKLEQIERRMPDVLSVTYADLEQEATCAQVFERCLSLPHDPAWWQAASAVNIQIDMAHCLRYFWAHAPQLTKLAKTAAHRIVSAMRPEEGEFDGVTFQVEPFSQFYRDAEPLFREHLVQTEQAPDDHARKNLPLLQLLDDVGMMQCLTARANGRMFGYLMTLVAPSMDSPDVIQGEHTLFFASPAIRGLGMRLQRAALETLRKRGVHEVIMRAGHRGSGPRLGTFYRRLGAEPFGQMYRLQLEDA
jgi:GNAT superfamily N-acetyltransferase